MRWVPDSSGRFAWRPYFTQEEVDIECERTVCGFLKHKYGECRFPISTGDLTVLIERDTSHLDLYADLSGEGEDVDGITDFFAARRPVVRISQKLSSDKWRQHELRSALAHEYGHVKFHTFLWESTFENRSPDLGKKLLQQRRKYHNTVAKLALDNVPDLETDWMEWQAGYAGEALLMPFSWMNKVAADEFKEAEGRLWLYEGADDGRKLVSTVAVFFDVSEKAAKSRLLNLGYLQKTA